MLETRFCNPKHYIMNSQETDRHGDNAIIDEKTLMELYAQPFEAAAATTAGYMCACTCHDRERGRERASGWGVAFAWTGRKATQ